MKAEMSGSDLNFWKFKPEKDLSKVAIKKVFFINC